MRLSGPVQTVTVFPVSHGLIRVELAPTAGDRPAHGYLVYADGLSWNGVKLSLPDFLVKLGNDFTADTQAVVCPETELYGASRTAEFTG